MKDRWEDIILDAYSDSETLDLLRRLLTEQDEAKQILRKKGYGMTGMGIKLTAMEVPGCNCKERREILDFEWTCPVHGFVKE